MHVLDHFLYNGYLAGGIDYGDNDTTPYNVTFPAGTSCSSFDIPILDDDTSEDDEIFRVTIMDMSLPFGTILGDDITADVVIEDDDSELTCLLSILNIHVIACNKCTYISQDIIFDYTL